MIRRLLSVSAGALMAILLLAQIADARFPKTFTAGFTDPGYQQPSEQSLWFDRTVSTGARLVLLRAQWPSIAPQPPASGTDPTDPANPAYHWGSLDSAVQAATARGLTVVIAVADGGGPAWADGPGRPASVPAGTWEPSASAFGAFASAVAKRYSGSFNPGSGTLPRVRYFQAWGEPNLPDHLNPQWVQQGGQWVPESPVIYRGLLNAFYAAVKAVHSDNVVITAGTAPFGDPPGGGDSRMPPAAFVRNVLCLDQGLNPLPCPDPAHFDILAHHPYELGPPTQPAFNTDDVSLPDMYKLTQPLAVAERTGRALPAGRKQVWVTEFSYNTNPPNPGGVPVAQDARWLEESFYILWHEGVDAIAWFILVDQPCVPSCNVTYQAGVYYLNGARKPAFYAFRFPFVAEPAKKHRAYVWGLAPKSGTLRVQARIHGHWRTVRRIHVRAHQVFYKRIRVHGRPVLRAHMRGVTSLTWRVGEQP